MINYSIIIRKVALMSNGLFIIHDNDNHLEAVIRWRNA
ncbi:hypothetical protein D1BOALGB6SA_7903 [Olavius sp. associated proteobacterium Delta 1]|nr:hypothetical protein D1BOALGB6SA_7903 [Olavius sp. associated proteobacterium Delta 1]